MMIYNTFTILGQGCNEDFRLNLVFLLQIVNNPKDDNSDTLRKSLKTFISYYKISEVRDKSNIIN